MLMLVVGFGSTLMSAGMARMGRAMFSADTNGGVPSIKCAVRRPATSVAPSVSGFRSLLFCFLYSFEFFLLYSDGSNIYLYSERKERLQEVLF